MLLHELEQLLFSPGRQRKAALTGLSGVGKTQVAIELTYRIRVTRPECSIFWIPATNPESLQRTYLQVAKTLRLPGLEEERSDPKKLLKNYLTDGNAGQWLLIYDNADDISMWFGKFPGNTEPYGLSDYVPWSSTGSVLFTTCFKKIATKLAMQNVIEIPAMDEANARELFGERLTDKTLLHDENETTLLLKQLVYLPLAIVQAASYINENCLKAVADYRSLLSEHEEEIIGLLSEEFHDDWRSQDITNPVATTWLISFERIHRTNRQASNILSFMACIQPTEIPESLLPPSQSRTAWSAAIGTLVGYSFVSRRPTGYFDVHQLVHLATRNWLRKKGKLSKWILKTLTRLEEIFPIDNDTNRAIWKAYLPHALRLAQDGEVRDNSTRYNLLYKVSICLFLDDRVTEAVGYLEERDKWLETQFDDQNPLRVDSRFALSVAYTDDWQTERAVELLELSVLKRTQGEENLFLLASQLALAGAYKANGRIKQAVELLEHVVSVLKITHVEEHPSLLDSQLALAGSYQEIGQIEQAVGLLEHVVSVT
jgi:hypothetical protein